MLPGIRLAGWTLAFAAFFASALQAEDLIRRLQERATEEKQASWGHWGPTPDSYHGWQNHSNRLIPIYTFGLNLKGVSGERSVYRDAEAIRRLYGRVPEGTLNPAAEYCDQTDVYRLQKQAAEEGKRRIILVVFDGMDWQTTAAAAIHKSGKVYRQGRGQGLAFQDYRGAETDFGWFVTSPWCGDAEVDAQGQIVKSLSDTHGGYDASLGGPAPWSKPADPLYPMGRSRQRPDVVTDSASSATSMTAGIKTYNYAINVDPQGGQVRTIAHDLQDAGFAIGVVTSVPISHATPAAAYAHNVSRNDYQNLSRDLVGLRSAAHRQTPLPGVDVLIGCGWGESVKDSSPPVNRYLPAEEIESIDVAHGGRYVVAQRTPGRKGADVLRQGAEQAVRDGQRLFGFFGVTGGHLPYRTADGGYNPTRGFKTAEKYSQAEVEENPTLAEMTEAALSVLEASERPYWLMVEAGDVDWANHNNNIDDSIGAVISGDEAFAAIARWIERHGGWDDTVVILTADHGHYLNLTDPEALIAPQAAGE